MDYAKQAVLHLRQDKDSEVRALLKTTTQFVSGGLQLASAVWNQDLGAVIEAVSGLKDAAVEFASSQPKRWCVRLARHALHYLVLGNDAVNGCLGCRV